MRYVQAKLEEFGEERAYRFYVSDCMKMIAENTSKLGGGTSPKNRFADAFKKPVPETRSSEEIIEQIRDKINRLEG